MIALIVGAFLNLCAFLLALMAGASLVSPERRARLGGAVFLILAFALCIASIALLVAN